MGEIAHIDLARLRKVADHFSNAAADVDDMPWPALEPDTLRGSAVSASVTSPLIRDGTRDLAADLRDWAAAARTSADAFELAETTNGERFTPR